VAVNSSPFRYALAVSDAEVQFVAHSRRIPGLLALNLSEADTRAHAIDPVLRLLGYNEVSDIRREVPIPATKEFLDYALLVAGQPQVLVEAKALRHPITDQHMGQSVAYAAVLGIEWCLITNGKQWIVCNAYAKGPLESKKVADVTLGGDDLQTAAAWKTLALFARESLMQANPLTELLVDRVLIDELGRGDSAVVAALRKAVRDRFGVNVPPQAVLGAVRRLNPQQGGPTTVAAASTDGDLPAPVSRPKLASPRRPELTTSRTNLSALVAAGLFRKTIESRLGSTA